MMKKMKFLIHYLLVALTLTSSQAVDDMDRKLAERMDAKAFSVRKTQLDEMINHFKALIPPALQSLTCINLYFKCDALHKLYGERRQFNKEHHLVDPACDNVYNSFLMEKVRDGRAEHWGTGGLGAPISLILRSDELNGLELSVKLIKADILESVEIYEKLYGPHPRRSEFIKK